MKKYGLISAIALIVLTNVVVLAGVAYNRSGEPDATVTLTERELHWKNSRSWSDREDSGLSLLLRWNMPGHFNYAWKPEESSWLNEEKLMELGFDTSYPLDEKTAGRFYNRQLPIQAYVVLEYNGNAYQNWRKQVRKEISNKQQDLLKEKDRNKKKGLENSVRSMEQELVTQSRLFTIDAGRDGPILRKQYPDRSKYIITPAEFIIQRHYVSKNKDDPKSHGKWYLGGWVRNILIKEIHITSDYRSFFISGIKTRTNSYLPRDKSLSNLEPRYQVTLNYGKRYEPWVVDVKKLK